MTNKKLHKFAVIEYLLTHGITLEEVADSTIDNLGPTGFIYGDKTVEIPPEVFEHLSKHVLTLKDELIFPGTKGKQSVSNMAVSLREYLKESGRTLADIGITGVYSPRQEVHFDSIADIKTYLQSKIQKVTVIPKKSKGA